jgi:hypothetical protein
MVHSHLYCHKREIVLLVLPRDVAVFGNIQLLPNTEVLAPSFPRTDCQFTFTCALQLRLTCCDTNFMFFMSRHSFTFGLCRLNLVQFEPKCTVPQSINHQRLSVAVRVRFHVSAHTICGGQCGSDTGFLRPLHFPCRIIPPMLHTHSFVTDGT